MVGFDSEWWVTQYDYTSNHLSLSVLLIGQGTNRLWRIEKPTRLKDDLSSVPKFIMTNRLIWHIQPHYYKYYYCDDPLAFDIDQWRSALRDPLRTAAYLRTSHRLTAYQQTHPSQCRQIRSEDPERIGQGEKGTQMGQLHHGLRLKERRNKESRHHLQGEQDEPRLIEQWGQFVDLHQECLSRSHRPREEGQERSAIRARKYPNQTFIVEGFLEGQEIRSTRWNYHQIHRQLRQTHGKGLRIDAVLQTNCRGTQLTINRTLWTL